MVAAEWLTLQEYSNKYKVSISTLRRKIKARDIEYTFKNGRYLLCVSSEDSFSEKEEQTSFKELKGLYRNLLSEKDKQIEELTIKIADLNQLVYFLEQEKNHLEEPDREPSLEI